MIEESKYCSNVVEKPFNKGLVMIKEDNEDFKNSTLLTVGPMTIIMLIIMLK